MVLMSKLNKTPHFCKYNYSSMRIPKKWEKKCLGMFNWKFESIYLPLSNNSKDDGYDRYVDDEWCSKIIYYNQVSISSRHKSYFHYVFVFRLFPTPQTICYDGGTKSTVCDSYMYIYKHTNNKLLYNTLRELNFVSLFSRFWMLIAKISSANYKFLRKSPIFLGKKKDFGKIRC